MKIDELQVVGTRCFANTHRLVFGPKCNLFVGKNNTGKSTLLKSLLTFQVPQFDQDDIRPGAQHSYQIIKISDANPDDLAVALGQATSHSAAKILLENDTIRFGSNTRKLGDRPLFHNVRPKNALVPFLAKRRSPAFDENVSLSTQTRISEMYDNLYSRLDQVVTAGHFRHDMFREALSSVVGIPITTTASQVGKRAGYYFSNEKFIPLDRMGDGIVEMVALIVELCLARGKIFILEEPEMNLHPRALKALLALIRQSSDENQFMIATHSNIVLTELAADESTEIFRVFRDGDEGTAPSQVEEVPRDTAAHMAVLRDLGYEFIDLGLYEGWLFLEESSAEQIITEVLVPLLVPELKGRLRTVSAGGVSNLAPTVSEFHRLIVFIHLQPAYQGRLWIRADGNDEGNRVTKALRDRFGYLTDSNCTIFSQAEFERYYPAAFQQRVTETFAEPNRNERRRKKAALLKDVVMWSKTNPEQAKLAWTESAKEPIELLSHIRDIIL
jgi:predicted ATPase